MYTVFESKNLGRPDNRANEMTNVTNVFEYNFPPINSRRRIGLYTPTLIKDNIYTQ